MVADQGRRRGGVDGRNERRKSSWKRGGVGGGAPPYCVRVEERPSTPLRFLAGFAVLNPGHSNRVTIRAPMSKGKTLSVFLSL